MNTKSAPASSAPSSASTFTNPEKKAVARVAYELWQRQGCPVGRDEMIWLEAERQVARGGVAKAAPKKETRLTKEDSEGLKNLDLISLPSDSPGRGPTSLP